MCCRTGSYTLLAGNLGMFPQGRLFLMASFHFQVAKASPLIGARCEMVCCPAISRARWTDLPQEMLLLLVYFPFSRQSSWPDRLTVR